MPRWDVPLAFQGTTVGSYAWWGSLLGVPLDEDIRVLISALPVFCGLFPYTLLQPWL
jgi:hypothetical protein